MTTIIPSSNYAGINFFIKIVFTFSYDSSNIKWTSSLTPVVVKPFTSHVGPRTILPDSVIGIFPLFFTSSIIKYIVEQTNLYASQCLSPESFLKWEKVSEDEMEAFFGFMILMGLVRLPSLSDYWSKEQTYHYAPIASRISRNRFMEINRYLHFADNTTLSPPGSAGYNK